MKKGFTLVELLAIVILLGILLTFTYTKIIDVSEKKKEEISDAKIQLINNAVLEYIEDKNYAQTFGQTYCIKLEDLEDENLVPVEIDDVKKSYDYVQVKIGANNKNSYVLVNSNKDNICK